MARVYATSGEFSASVWCPAAGAPTGKPLERLLRTVSRTVEGLTRNARYETDVNGLPTDPVIAEAFRDATCAQAAYAHETGDVSGAGVGASNMSIGSLSLGGSTVRPKNVDEVQTALLSAEAVGILRAENLATGWVGEVW
ncbi:hypothetical protein CQ010_01525 [Arthrobacter sp. MYb211]|uniref:hypothetical protein n=1 Tax=unclassified Arthrobacter TaxID=235627 RepID=UPI000CFC5788|nr:MULTISPECIES: hypothetical protein [unclassified Arthrobacter]PRA13354.1 hypothetical protein CQ015_03780 [Arthrobacter sp. MYb221]PRC10551.1 hypothetical protein CQ010_01525 [Arthrobacter sp. MYb211]